MDTYLKVWTNVTATNVTDFAASAGSTLKRIYEFTRSEAAIKRYKILAEVTLRILEIVYKIVIAIAVTIWETAQNCLEESEVVETAEVESAANSISTCKQQVSAASMVRTMPHPAVSVLKVKESNSIAQIAVEGEGTRTRNTESMTVEELRALCTAKGIRWNRGGASEKHMTKTEMLAALG